MMGLTAIGVLIRGLYTDVAHLVHLSRFIPNISMTVAVEMLLVRGITRLNRKTVYGSSAIMATLAKVGKSHIQAGGVFLVTSWLMTFSTSR